MSDLIRVAYLSSNALSSPEDGVLEAINEILAVSQDRNRRAGVTGALMFNRGFFGQVLEGPAEAVEDTFERIQNDERHREIAILDSKPIAELSFPDWSMGFVGSDHALGAAFRREAPDQPFDVAALNGDEMCRVLIRIALERELTLTAA